MDKELVKAELNDFDETLIVNGKHDGFDEKEIVYDPSDIRMVFAEAIEDFYNFSENGGPR